MNLALQCISVVIVSAFCCYLLDAFLLSEVYFLYVQCIRVLAVDWPFTYCGIVCVYRQQDRYY